MIEGDMLAATLTDIRRRLADLQSQSDRISEELSKLRLAERSLAAIVEGTPPSEPIAVMPQGDSGGGDDAPRDEAPREARTGRVSRIPRANSAKGRLRTVLENAGPQGLSQAEIARRLPDIAPNTLASYLSMMVSSGEALRKGDFITARPGPRPKAQTDSDAPQDGTVADEAPTRRSKRVRTA